MARSRCPCVGRQPSNSAPFTATRGIVMQLVPRAQSVRVAAQSTQWPSSQVPLRQSSSPAQLAGRRRRRVRHVQFATQAVGRRVDLGALDPARQAGARSRTRPGRSRRACHAATARRPLTQRVAVATIGCAVAARLRSMPSHALQRAVAVVVLPHDSPTPAAAAPDERGDEHQRGEESVSIGGGHRVWRKLRVYNALSSEGIAVPFVSPVVCLVLLVVMGVVRRPPPARRSMTTRPSRPRRCRPRPAAGRASAEPAETEPDCSKPGDPRCAAVGPPGVAGDEVEYGVGVRLRSVSLPSRCSSSVRARVDQGETTCGGLKIQCADAFKAARLSLPEGEGK